MALSKGAKIEMIDEGVAALPEILASTDPGGFRAEEKLEARAVDVLFKPFTASALLDAMTAAVRVN